jgi:hypothetical protein
LVAGNAERLLLDTLLSDLRELGLIKACGRQRTDSTHVLADVRKLKARHLSGRGRGKTRKRIRARPGSFAGPAEF